MIYIKLAVVLVTAITGWLLAALQYHPSWKDGRTVRYKAGRKTVFIVFPITLVLTLLFTYCDHQETTRLRGEVAKYLKKQCEADKPNLVVLKAEGQYDDIKLVIKNVGTQSTDKLYVVFTTNNIPSNSISYTASWHEDFPAGVERAVSIFPVHVLCDRKISSPESTQTLRNSLEKFDREEMMFWFGFHLEYLFGNEKIISDNYHFTLDKKRGVLFFGKSTAAIPPKGSAP